MIDLLSPIVEQKTTNTAYKIGQETRNKEKSQIIFFLVKKNTRALKAILLFFFGDGPVAQTSTVRLRIEISLRFNFTK